MPKQTTKKSTLTEIKATTPDKQPQSDAQHCLTWIKDTTPDKQPARHLFQGDAWLGSIYKNTGVWVVYQVVKGDIKRVHTAKSCSEAKIALINILKGMQWKKTSKNWVVNLYKQYAIRLRLQKKAVLVK